MNTELILYLWALLPLHAVSHLVRLHRSEKEYPLLVLNFDSETFQRIHGSEILSQLKQKKKIPIMHYQDSLQEQLCCPREHT